MLCPLPTYILDMNTFSRVINMYGDGERCRKISEWVWSDIILFRYVFNSRHQGEHKHRILVLSRGRGQEEFQGNFNIGVFCILSQ